MSQSNNTHGGYVKDIWLEVPSYKFEHKPLDDVKSSKWVGRNEINKKLLSYLEDGESGAYLITGYRGMGKTSFVRRAVKTYTEEATKKIKCQYRNSLGKEFTQKKQREKRAIRTVTVSFGQKNIKELDVLRQIVKGMMDEIIPHKFFEFFQQRIFHYRALPLWVAVVFLFLILCNGEPLKPQTFENGHYASVESFHANGSHTNALNTDATTLGEIPVTNSSHGFKLIMEWNPEESLWDKLKSPHGFEVGGTLLVLSTIIGFLLQTWFIFLFRKAVRSVKYYERLEDMYDRCRSQITKEDGGGGVSEKMPFSLVDKMVKKFPIANPKEMENEIISLLEEYQGKAEEDIHPFWKKVAKIPCLNYALKWSFVAQLFLISSTIAMTTYVWICLDINGILNYYAPPHAKIRTIFLIMVSIVVISLFAIGVKYCNRLKNLFLMRKFIFIFDEIDKIDPSANGPSHEEHDSPTAHTTTTDMRERRKAVIEILANLKYLITTARAKFIFIAGREMFDAALADVADRQSVVSSIFHQVINVDSFLKDQEDIEESGGKTTGITMLVEEYLYKILLAPYRRQEDANPTTDLLGNAIEPGMIPYPSERKDRKDSFVRCYREFLSRYGHLQDHDRNKQYLRAANENTVHKVIFELQNLIIYLTYRSNGSPKKLASLVEELMRPNDAIERYGQGFFEGDQTIWLNMPRIKTTSTVTKKYYIHLGYYNQFRFGFINYIVRPFMSTHVSVYKTYSDKILVSTPYLFDHIIKFHAFAFSLQNLELMPEVLSETRAPELRNFIEDLVTYLGQSHLRDAHIGLFDYKFYHKTYHEIEFLCKIFETESAAFNFSLDENYNVKLHLRNKIKALRNVYKEFITGQETPYISSIAYLNETLGNAQFFDQEYDDAIISYLDALHALERHVLNDEGIHFNYEKLVSYINLKLKLGLTYEKVKDYENAYAIYNETFLRAETYLQNKTTYNSETVDNFGREDLLQIVIEPVLASMYLQEKMDTTTLTNDKIRQFADRIEKISARLRKNLGSSTNENDAQQHDRTNITFSFGVGTLLYYKNASSDQTLYSTAGNPVIGEFLNLICYQLVVKERKKGIQQNSDKNDHNRWHDYRVSASSYKHLRDALEGLLRCNNSLMPNSTGLSLIFLLQQTETLISTFIGTRDINPVSNPELVIRHDKAYLRSVATALYKIADCLYCGIRASEPGVRLEERTNTVITTNGRLNTEPDQISGWSFYNFDAAQLDVLLGDAVKHEKELDKILFQLVICMYYWSGRLFMHIGKNQSCNLMFRKIIQSFRILADAQTVVDYELIIQKKLLKQIMLISSWNSNAADKYQVKKSMYSLGVDEEKMAAIEKHLLNPSAQLTEEDNKFIDLYEKCKVNTSACAELREGKMLFNEMRLKAWKEKNADALVEEIEKELGQYQTIPTQITRYQELRLRVHLNERKLFAICECDLTTMIKIIYKLGNNELHKDLDFVKCGEEAGDVIVNSIFCLFQIINIYNGFGLNYHMSYHSYGKNRERMGNWLTLYKMCGRPQSQKLNAMLGNDVVRTFDEFSEYQLALQHFSRARQLHSEGSPYKNQAVNMFYLEDDFNDGLYSYGIAVERQRINSGIMRRDIDILRKIVEG